MKVVVAPLAEFQPNTRRIVRVGGREIGVFRVEDRFYAVRNRCPHQGGPLCAGHIFARIVSERPGEFTLAEGPPLLTCPWHGSVFRIADGSDNLPALDLRQDAAAIRAVERTDTLDDRHDRPSMILAGHAAAHIPNSADGHIWEADSDSIAPLERFVHSPAYNAGGTSGGADAPKLGRGRHHRGRRDRLLDRAESDRSWSA